MKTLTILTAVAALVAGMSIASAQNQGGTAAPGASPSNINKGADDSTKSGAQSGSQSGSSAMQSSGATKGKVTGTGKFCIEISKGGGIECKFADLATCQKDAQSRDLQCSPNPNSGTTGAK